VDRPNSLPDSGTSAAVSQSLWDIKQAADYFHVSESWIRRHLSELPHSRHGRLIRFDPEGLKRTVVDRKSLEPKEPIMVNRFQRGSWKVRGKKKMVYGRFRLETLDAKGEREIAVVKLGLRKEFATEYAIQKKLDAVMDEMLKPGTVPPSAKTMTFSELSEEWKTVEGPAIKRKSLASYDHYVDALRAYILDWHPSVGGKAFKDRLLADIQRKDVQQLLNDQATKYGESTLRSIKVALRKVLLYAEVNGYVERPTGWLNRIALAETHGRNVARIELTPEQTLSIVAQLQEPYATLVLTIALLGLRIQAAIGIQPDDLDSDNVLRIHRVLYKGKVVLLTEKEQQKNVFPLDALDANHADLIRRIRALGEGHEWVFRSRTGTPINPGNALRRYLHPATEAVGVRIGGFHDFRHTLYRTLRREGVKPRVISDVLGHEGVNVGATVYDRANRSDLRDALGVMSKQLQSGRQLEPNLEPNRFVQ
jgi:integrase